MPPSEVPLKPDQAEPVRHAGSFLLYETVRQHARNTGVMPVIGITVATGLLFVAWPGGSHPELLAWFGLVCAVNAFWGLTHLWLQRPAQAQWAPARCIAVYRACNLLHGCAWGAAAWLLHASPENPAHHALLFAVLIMAVATAASSSFDLSSATLFCAPALLPGAAHFTVHDLTPLSLTALALSLGLAAAAAARNRSGFLAETERRRQVLIRQRLESEKLERLRRAVALAGVGSWDFDPATGTVDFDQSVSLALRYGKGGPEPMERVLSRLEPASAAALRRAVEEACRTGKSLSQEVQMSSEHHADLPRVVLLSAGAIVEDGKVVRLAGTLQDISWLRKQEQEIADQNRLRQQLLENTSQGIWFLDSQGLTTDVNPAMCRLLGRQREEVLGKSVFDFFHGADLAILNHQLELRKRGHKEGYEIGIARPDGTRVECFNNATPIYDAAGRKLGSVGMWTDLTPLKHALTQAMETRKELYALLDGFPGFVAAIDAEDRYTFINRRMAQRYGRTPQEVIGLRLKDLVPESRWREVQAWRRRADAGEVLVDVRQVEPLEPGGEPIWLQSTRLAGRPTADGRRQYYSFGTDITALKQAEQSLAQREEQLRAALAAAEAASRTKSEFLSQVSHELRTPMNAILGFAQLLETDREHPLVPAQQLKVQEMLSGAQQLLELINGLLDLGRIEAGHFSVALRPVALKPVLRKCLDLVQPLAQRQGITLRMDDGVPAELAARADTARLTQVVLNLLSNAIKYNRPQGRVVLRVGAVAERVCIEVQDTGRGLTPLEQERLFEPFQRLRAEGSGLEGTGIGLALSRRLTEAMGGTLTVRSTLGEGSSFLIHMNRAEDIAHRPDRQGEPSDVADEESQADEDLALSGTVLYIEDNPVNALVLEAMFSRMPGLRMLHAEDGVPGLAMAMTHAPDLILTDIHMPGMDGFELLQRLQEHPATRFTPVVAVTADVTAHSVERGRRASFTEYLTKPVQMKALHALLRRLLAPAHAARAPLSASAAVDATASAPQPD